MLVDPFCLPRLCLRYEHRHELEAPTILWELLERVHIRSANPIKEQHVQRPIALRR